MLRKTLSLVMVAAIVGPLSFTQLGCYNTYRVSLSELEKVQEGGDRSVVRVATTGEGCPAELPDELRAIEGVKTDIEIPEGATELGDDVLAPLESDIAVITQEAGMSVLVRVSAHGTEDNDATSESRAESVKRWLVGKGIGEDRITAIGIGAMPAPHYSPPEELTGRSLDSLNDRVELYVCKDDDIEVTVNTKVGVTTSNGDYTPISAYNFTLTRSFLVAPDEDVLEARENIETGNVRLVSGTKTALIVAGAVAVLAGLGTYVLLTADEECGQFGCE